MSSPARIRVPYHLDEYQPDLDVPLEVADTVSAQLPAGDPWAAMATLYRLVAGRVAALVGRGQRPLVVSGDCTTALGVMAGLQQAGIEPGIVWFDAHGDVQTMETTTSGYVGGFALRLMVGYRPDLIATRIGLRATPESWVTLVGARDLDPPEVAYLATADITRRPVAELSVDGLPDRPLYLHVDLDVVDPAQLPGLRFPAPGGPSLEEVATALDRVLGTGRVAAVGLACTWYPGSGAAARIGQRLQAVFEAW